jgi:hypothetical protein
VRGINGYYRVAVHVQDTLQVREEPVDAEGGDSQFLCEGRLHEHSVPRPQRADRIGNPLSFQATSQYRHLFGEGFRTQEIVDPKWPASGCATREEERPYRESLHQAVEELVNLLGF